MAKGRPEIPPSPLCFFNPLHGDAAAKIDWRPIGSRRRLRVHACRACARAARAKETPDILMDRRDGRDVPYFEADPAQSVWAETGYGQLRDDLIHRVLRGDWSAYGASMSAVRLASVPGMPWSVARLSAMARRRRMRRWRPW